MKYQRLSRENWLGLKIGGLVLRAYADDELGGVDELVIEDCSEDGGSKLSCCAGKC